MSMVSSASGRLFKTRWIITAALVLLLLMLFAGLYAFSGLPRPWGSTTPKAHERVSFQRFRVLSEAIGSIGKDVTANQRKDVLEKAGVRFDGKVGNFEGEQFQVVEPVGSFGIVVFGQEQDQNGMIWAITHDGQVIKVSRCRQ